MELVKKARAWLRARLTDDGLEKLDPTPVEIPLEFDRPLTLEERMARMMSVRHRMMQAVSGEELETEEEANDFDIDDDPLDPLTPYEAEFLPKSEAVVPLEQFAAEEAASSGSGAQAPDGDAEPAPEIEPESVSEPVKKTRVRKSAVST